MKRKVKVPTWTFDFPFVKFNFLDRFIIEALDTEMKYRAFLTKKDKASRMRKKIYQMWGD